MNIRADTGLTFDDVLMVPKRSSIRSRSHVDSSTWLGPGVRLEMPILSANMDTVTEAPMAIAMAQSGGMGIIHRFMPIDRQAEAVSKVKRAESFLVENPLTIHSEASIDQARRIMAEADIGGLRSGMSYAGAATIPELWAKAEFIRITSAGQAESQPHDVKLL